MLRRVHLSNGIFKECLNQKRSVSIVHTHETIITKENWINGALGTALLIQILVIVIACSCCRRRRAKKILTQTLEIESKKPRNTTEKWSLNTEGNEAP